VESGEMKIEVKVIPKAKQNLIKQEWSLYDIPKSRIEIIKGLKSRHKMIIINEA